MHSRIILFISLLVSIVFISCSDPILPEVAVGYTLKDYGKVRMVNSGRNINASSWIFGSGGQIIYESDEQGVVTSSLKTVYNRNAYGNEMEFQFYENGLHTIVTHGSYEGELDSVHTLVEVTNVPDTMRISKIALNRSDFDTSVVILKIEQAEYDQQAKSDLAELVLVDYEKQIVVQDTILLDSVVLPLPDFDLRHIYYAQFKTLKFSFYKGAVDDDNLITYMSLDMKDVVPSYQAYEMYDGTVKEWYPSEKSINYGTKVITLYNQWN